MKKKLLLFSIPTTLGVLGSIGLTSCLVSNTPASYTIDLPEGFDNNSTINVEYVKDGGQAVVKDSFGNDSTYKKWSIKQVGDYTNFQINENDGHLFVADKDVLVGTYHITIVCTVINDSNIDALDSTEQVEKPITINIVPSNDLSITSYDNNGFKKNDNNLYYTDSNDGTDWISSINKSWSSTLYTATDTISSWSVYEGDNVSQNFVAVTNNESSCYISTLSTNTIYPNNVYPVTLVGKNSNYEDAKLEFEINVSTNTLRISSTSVNESYVYSESMMPITSFTANMSNTIFSITSIQYGSDEEVDGDDISSMFTISNESLYYGSGANVGKYYLTITASNSDKSISSSIEFDITTNTNYFISGSSSIECSLTSGEHVIGEYSAMLNGSSRKLNGCTWSFEGGSNTHKYDSYLSINSSTGALSIDISNSSDSNDSYFSENVIIKCTKNNYEIENYQIESINIHFDDALAYYASQSSYTKSSSIEYSTSEQEIYNFSDWSAAGATFDLASSNTASGFEIINEDNTYKLVTKKYKHTFPTVSSTPDVGTYNLPIVISKEGYASKEFTFNVGINPNNNYSIIGPGTVSSMYGNNYGEVLGDYDINNTNLSSSGWHWELSSSKNDSNENDPNENDPNENDQNENDPNYFSIDQNTGTLTINQTSVPAGVYSNIYISYVNSADSINNNYSITPLQITVNIYPNNNSISINTLNITKDVSNFPPNGLITSLTGTVPLGTSSSWSLYSSESTSNQNSNFSITESNLYWSSGTPQVGIYTVDLQLSVNNDNYVPVTKTITVNITGSNIAIGDLNLNNNIYVTYCASSSSISGDQWQTTSNIIQLTNTNGHDLTDVNWSTDNSNFQLISQEDGSAILEYKKGTNVGIYTVTALASSNSFSKTKTITITVSQGTATINLTNDDQPVDGNTFYYEYGYHGKICDVSVGSGDTTLSNINWSTSNPANFGINNNNELVTMRSNVEHGEYTIEIYATNSNYTIEKKTVQIVVSPNNSLTISGDSSVSSTYTSGGGVELATYTTATELNGVTWAVTGENSSKFYIDPNGVLKTKTGTAVPNAGTYNLTITASKNNYVTKSFDVEVTITPATVQDMITTNQGQTSYSVSYGNTNTVAILQVESAFSGGTWSISSGNNNGYFVINGSGYVSCNSQNLPPVGSYSLTISYTKANYTTATKTITINVTPATMSITNGDSYDLSVDSSIELTSNIPGGSWDISSISLSESSVVEENENGGGHTGNTEEPYGFAIDGNNLTIEQSNNLEVGNTYAVIITYTKANYTTVTKTIYITIVDSSTPI